MMSDVKHAGDEPKIIMLQRTASSSECSLTRTTRAQPRAVIESNDRKRKDSGPYLSRVAVHSKRLRGSKPWPDPIIEGLTPENALSSPGCQAPWLELMADHFETEDEESRPAREVQLVDAITSVLESICTVNRNFPKLPSSPGHAPYRSVAYPDGSSSIFFSLQKPSIVMRQYVARLVRYLHVSRSVYVVSLIYLDRVHENDEMLALTELNVHRLITTALAVASKYLEDECHRNSTVRRIGGVPTTEEMNLLESQFLRRLGWDCSVSPVSYALYENNIFKRAVCRTQKLL